MTAEELEQLIRSYGGGTTQTITSPASTYQSGWELFGMPGNPDYPVDISLGGTTTQNSSYPSGMYRDYAAELAAQQKQASDELAYKYAALAQQMKMFQTPPAASTEDNRWRYDQLALQQQQMANEAAYQQSQLAADKEARLAQLSAQPRTWLQYAALSGQNPVIQPWMLPLMKSDYGLNAGAPIPGWTPENMTGMPQLTSPSAQYLNRIGPTAQQQYYGYEQARTGATPEESQWRLWSRSPPGGGSKGLIQQR